ncbi:MAG: glycosyltransferase family 2 protein, partial [Pirellulales bacterium]
MNLEDLPLDDRWHVINALVQLQQEAGTSNTGQAPDVIALAEQLLGKGVCRRLGIYRLPENFLLSVVIPVFNEARTIEESIRRVRACGIACELIVVDDGSTDGTRDILRGLPAADDLRIVYHERNQGKGAALR